MNVFKKALKQTVEDIGYTYAVTWPILLIIGLVFNLKNRDLL